MDERERTIHWLALARVPGAVEEGAGRRFLGRIAEAFAAPHAETEPGWGEALTRAARRLPEAEAELSRAASAGARAVSIDMAEYPPLLREIPDPPPVLFVRGRIVPDDVRSVAVIGSRLATRYGLLTTRRVVRGLALGGVTIVSGMAIGIDSEAHRAALGAGGRTIAVLGTGIDVAYPSQSRDLYQEIPKAGAVVSETSPGTPPEPRVFPARNRIIAGIAWPTVVIEAKKDSGTSITARFAIDRGRPLGAVPGDVDLARSEGTNQWISEGAFPVRGPKDVLAHGLGEVAADEPRLRGAAS